MVGVKSVIRETVKFLQMIVPKRLPYVKLQAILVFKHLLKIEQEKRLLVQYVDIVPQ